jgi:hypothetical protein
MRIKSNPSEATLSPGQSASFELEIESIANKTMFFGLEFLIGECRDHPRGYFNSPYFKLNPSEKMNVILIVNTSKVWFKNEEHNNAEIVVYWGQNLSRDNSRFDSTCDGHYFFRIDIREDNLIPYLSISIPILLAIVIIGYYLYRKRNKQKKKK